MNKKELPLPDFYNPKMTGKVWKVNFEERANDANMWTEKFGIKPSTEDKFKACLLVVDMQNTFCVPGYELFVGGQSGNGAVEDTARLCRFIYRNLGVITSIIPTMDTHHPLQIFHPVFLINEKGEHPAPYTLISSEDVLNGKWKVNPDASSSLGIDPAAAQKYLLEYTSMLNASGKYNLTVWPYHAMLGSISHALVSSLEEAIFFHSIARYSRIDYQIKGDNPVTEHYSVFGPEIGSGVNGKFISSKNDVLINNLVGYDAIIIAGEAKSHCVAWTVEDLMKEFIKKDKKLLQKVYLLEDCTSPVVIPGVIDYTEEAGNAYKRFAEAGMHVVRSSEDFLFKIDE